VSRTTLPIVAVSRPNLPGERLRLLMAAADVRVWEHEEPPTKDELATLASDAAALLCVHGDTIDTHLLERCPDLSIVAVASRGHDSVDLTAAHTRRVAVTTTPGALKDATADLAFALILAVRRRIVEADRYVRAGSWRSNPLDLLVGHDVHSSRLGIVGYGEIGRAVARRATGFGMDIRHHTRSAAADAVSTWLELDELLATSDIVTLHTPLTSETQSLIGERELRLMKPTASLINTARGGIVDQAALIRALNEGWIYSAGLDVQAVEPNPNPGAAAEPRITSVPATAQRPPSRASHSTITKPRPSPSRSSRKAGSSSTSSTGRSTTRAGAAMSHPSTSSMPATWDTRPRGIRRTDTSRST
jgi:lactate dehydrogenase-like 2-hydroxyacid dehydrogenase